MKSVLCKKNFFPFRKGNYYNVVGIHSIFQDNDFISIISNPNNTLPYRFRLNRSTQYIEDYIGQNEYYFYDYFVDITKDRLEKLKKLNS